MEVIQINERGKELLEIGRELDKRQFDSLAYLKSALALDDKLRNNILKKIIKEGKKNGKNKNH